MAQLNIGNQLLGASNVQFPPAASKAVCRFQNTHAYPITVTTFRGTWLANGTAKLKAVVYSDTGGLPDALMGTSDEKVGVTSGYNKLTFSTPVVIPAGAFIWFGVIADVLLQSMQCLATGDIKYNADTYADGPAATFGAATTAAFTYPMWLEGDDGQPRFGRASIDTESGNYQPDREHGEPFVLGGTDPVSVTSISTYVKTTSGTAKSKAAIFNDSGGLPSTKVAQTVEVTGTTAETWLELPFAAPETLTPGTYWLCFVSSENLVTPVIPQGGLLRADGTDTEATAFSSPSTLSTSIAPKGIDIYASYTPIAATPPEGAHLYWRINVTANNGDGTLVAIAEVEMRATLGGVDQCDGGTASASSNEPGGPPANAFDNAGPGTYWQTNSVTTGWLRYQFVAPVTVLEYTIQARTLGTARTPKDWTLEFSDDGEAWTVADTRVGEVAWSGGQIRTYEAPVVPATLPAVAGGNFDGVFAAVRDVIRNAVL